MFQKVKTWTEKHRAVVIGVACVLVCACAYGAWHVATSPKMLNGAYLIELNEDGFDPETLVIKEGDTVVFKTNNNAPFWPASNVHPTHTAYPDFDPKEPVPQDETWEFTFTEAGTYDFHDHIVSTYEGSIIVEKADGSRVSVDCSTERTVQCWEKLMIETLDEEGVEAALNEILYLSETEPLFINDCHGYSHLIGEKAYRLYAEHDNFELTPATALCGYGFFHGFMETLLLTTGNIEEAREFCKFVDAQLAGKASAAATACYHGTGHGAIDGSDPTAWGDIDALMAPGFDLCNLLAENDFQLYLCETGVFNAIEVLSVDPKFGITDIREDPYAMCNEQPVRRREACYSNMLPVVSRKYSSFPEVLQYVNDNMIDGEYPAIDGHTVNELTTIGIMFEFIRVYGETPGYAEMGIELCREQPEDDHLACIEGLSGGHIKYGEPGVEYVKNLEFCENTMLTPEERDACYMYTLKRITGRYDLEKSKMICDMVDVEYREKYCKFY